MLTGVCQVGNLMYSNFYVQMVLRNCLVMK
jgi:hypothetical protein